MADIYLVVKDAVYQHGVHGASLDRQKAIDMAEACAREDVDDHHEWLVFRVPLDEKHPESGEMFGEGWTNNPSGVSGATAGDVVFQTKKQQKEGTGNVDG